MIQQNCNKQHFTINSATSSNPAKRTLKSIYHTFNFVFSVWPEVNRDMHPCGLDRICEHPRATKFTQRLTEWWVHHCGDECCTPQQSLTIVVPSRIHALTTTAMSQRSDQRHVLQRCPWFLLDTNNKPCCREQPVVITLLLKYLFYIFTILPPLPTNIKKNP